MSHKLPTINAEELLSCPMPPTRFIIDQLLPQGLHILAGATKIGKSWLALALCLCVVKGEALWSFAAQKCGVLYLCLSVSAADSWISRRMHRIRYTFLSCRHNSTTVWNSR